LRRSLLFTLKELVAVQGPRISINLTAFAEKIGCNTRSVRRRIRWLIEARVLTAVDRVGGRNRGCTLEVNQISLEMALKRYEEVVRIIPFEPEPCVTVPDEAPSGASTALSADGAVEAPYQHCAASTGEKGIGGQGRRNAPTLPARSKLGHLSPNTPLVRKPFQGFSEERGVVAAIRSQPSKILNTTLGLKGDFQSDRAQASSSLRDSPRKTPNNIWRPIQGALVTLPETPPGQVDDCPLKLPPRLAQRRAPISEQEADEWAAKMLRKVSERGP
jgi:hypothetical protein